MNGVKDVVVYLVEKGADFFIKNKNNKVPAEEAFDKQYFEISEYIVDKEIALNKDKLKEMSGHKIEADDHIDLNVDVNEVETKENLDKLDINK